jgi:hypothetical protein
MGDHNAYATKTRGRKEGNGGHGSARCVFVAKCSCGFRQVTDNKLGMRGCEAAVRRHLGEVA